MNPLRDKLKELVDRMDLESENHNAHDFVNCNRALAVLSLRVLGLTQTIKLFCAIDSESNGDGLAGLTGVSDWHFQQD